MPSLVFCRGYEGILCSQALLCSQHTPFLLPTLSKALDPMLLSQQSTLGPHQDPEHPHLPPLPEQGRESALFRIRPCLPKCLSQPLPQRLTPAPWIHPSWGSSKHSSLPCSALSALRPRFMRPLHGCGCKRSPEAFAAMPQAAKGSLHPWSSPGFEQGPCPASRPCSGTQGGSGWMCASLTMGFHLTDTDLSVEIKCETVVASIVWILGGALKEQKERNWDTGPDMLQLSVTTSSLLHWI